MSDRVLVERDLLESLICIAACLGEEGYAKHSLYGDEEPAARREFNETLRKAIDHLKAK